MHGFFSVTQQMPAFCIVSRMAKDNGKISIKKICAALADELGYELVDAGFEKEGATQYLRIYLDSEQGISLKDCESYHRRVQPLLEEVEYDFLEVSSPGIDRPIRTQAYAQKTVGSLVEIRLYQPLDGQKAFTGIFGGLDDEGYHLTVGDKQLTFPAKSVAVAKRTINLEEALAAQADEIEEEDNER